MSTNTKPTFTVVSSSVDAELKYFKASELVLSPINPRQEVEEAGIELLAQSIEACGLIQNLSAYQNKSKIEIVAGGRRLRALQLLAERGVEVSVPVKVTTDLAVARDWAFAENSARQDLNPADEIVAFSKMKEAGKAVGEIAKAFGVTENRVYKLLALSKLPEVAIAALKEGKITLEYAQIMTTCPRPERIKAALKEIENGDIRSGYYLKTFLQEDDLDLDNRMVRYIGLDAYKEAGGTLTADLFFDDGIVLHDHELVHRLFDEKLDAAVEKQQAKGFGEVVVSDAYYGVYDYEIEREGRVLYKKSTSKLSKEKMGLLGIYVGVLHNGELFVSTPSICKSNQEKAVELGLIYQADLPKKGAGKSIDPADYSTALKEDVQNLQLFADQTALLDNPELARDLFAFNLVGTKGLYTNVFDISFKNCGQVSQNEGLQIDSRLRTGPEEFEEGLSIKERFLAFQAKGKDFREEVITNHLARSLTVGTGWTRQSSMELSEVIAEQAGSDMRKVWKPTKENLFKRMTSTRLDMVYADLFGEDDLAGFKKKKKKEKAQQLHDFFNDEKAFELLSDDQKALVRSWKPEIL